MQKKTEQLDSNNRLIRNFWDINHTMRYISEGKGSQKRILMLLKENGGMTQRELTEKLGIQPGSASEVLGKLESAGLITRAPSREDRRTADICLTPAGETAAGEAYERREQRHREMFACFSEEEKQTLLGLLETLNGAWERQYRGGHSRPAPEPGGKGRRHGHRA